jgi:hypothetical protein
MGGGGGAVMRQRFLTLVHGDMETIKMMPATYAVRKEPMVLLDIKADCFDPLFRKQKLWQEIGYDHLPMLASTSEFPSNTPRYKHLYVLITL